MLKEIFGSGKAVPEPDVAALQERVAELRAETIETLLVIDHITLQENPVIEADYAVKIGYLANDLAAAELAVRRARRKLTMAQAAINRAQATSDAELEEALNIEFAQWEAEIQAALARAFELIEMRTHMVALSDADDKRLKTLYRQLAKRLHPDVNPNQSETEAHLFEVAQAAYQKGDVATLEALAYSLGAGEEEALPNTTAELSTEVLMLETQLAFHRDRLEELKLSFPYVMKEKLADVRWVASTAADLRAKIAECTRDAEAYTQRYKELMADGA